MATPYEAFGFPADKKELIASSKATRQALDLVMEDAKEIGVSKTSEDKALLLLSFAPAFPKAVPLTNARKCVVKAILDGRIATSAQVTAAVKHFKGLKKKHKTTDMMPFDEKEFEEACGVGVVVTAEQIAATVKEVLDSFKGLDEQRYRCKGRLLGKINPKLKWADGKIMQAELDRQLLERLGPMTEADKKPLPKKKKDKKKDKGAKKVKEEVKEEVDDFHQGREIPASINTKEQMDRHLKATGGSVVTRFPPEPNGFLHLGHAKAIRFNFGVGRRFNGYTILRFDDTNPGAEEKRYIDNIVECVRWLGNKPKKTTFSSDYFDDLYALAVKLIKKGKAYVCHQTKAEMEKYREEKKGSPYRERSVEENLKLFEDMRKGKFPEGHCTLRMKGDLSHPNPNISGDHVAYRIKYEEHPHVGDRWCVYPSYDFTHCIVDSLENITHSLCTLEFEVRRESYYWLLDELNMYKPKVWEYSRLNVERNVMSKRKLKALVEEKVVNGWDDPRLLTLMGLKRRGYTADVINAFCDLVGVSRNSNMISMSLLEYCCRQGLDDSSKRAFAVLDPIRVVLLNYPANKTESFDAPVFPQKKGDKATRSMPFSRVVYIDRDDFRMEDNPKYYGLAPNKRVYLKYAYLIECKEVVQDNDGKVVELRCTADLDSLKNRDKKIKGHLHWVAEPAAGKAPIKAEIRLYDYLFNHKNPGAQDDWRSLVNKDSLKVTHGYVEPSVLDGFSSGERFQFERLGYFCFDQDSTKDALVLNRTITLKVGKAKP